MKRAVVVGALLGLLAIAVAGCGGYGNSKSKSTSESEGGKKQIAGVSANDHGSKSVSDESEVELDDYYFEPTVLKGKPGQKVTLELKNEGKVEHNFTLDSQGIDKDIEAGEDAKVSVTIPKSGAVSFYCKYHKSRGMAGGLTTRGNNDVSGAGGGTGSSGASGSYGYSP
jgi:plastocyanin